MNNKISVNSDNIFPIIKKFLYSNKEIFLRELISNATDAISKLKTISRLNNLNINNDFKIKVIINEKNKSIHIIDNGIGMNEKEINKYINQIAFSGAEEFIKKYSKDSSSIIGNFGLGFYSSFMVSNKVTILTQSYNDIYPSILWTCDGSTTFFIKEIEKKNRGTEVILYIDDNNKEYLEYSNILKLLQKYCKFMPFPIYISLFNNENNKETIVNNVFPIWKNNPSKLKNEDYIKFHHELYTNQLDDPLFWIHLNIDHPFNLNGILFFPKIDKQIDIQREKIHLYQNRVFITDELQGIVPDFLSLLRGVIDSPDIPLNVSRSHLQNDNSVKNISKYIIRKVSDKLNLLFNNNRKNFQKKWEHIKIVIEYGIISDNNFFDKAIKFFLFTTIDDDYYTIEEFKNLIKEKQINKEGKIVFLYSSDKNSQFSAIEDSKARDYKILLLNSPLSIHIIQKFESFYNDICFVRVDSDHIDKLIKRNINEKQEEKLSEIDKNKIKNYIINNDLIKKYGFSIELEYLSENDRPFTIIIPEFLRRIQDMNSLGNTLSNKEINKYQLIINTCNPLIKKILQINSEEKRVEVIQDMLNLTLLSKNMLHGKELSEFISKKFKEL
ncbi:molecular chaperone HtpG [Blattabacterium cuenoti]|uniref:molecular chaperone HtpG n=1 Tax=Blattabacterium cuenoti TaxID=1653831 RepID=UPI00163C6D10|nr:molecular chaperone HtpG [Blattabacterium cuenoti]